MTETTWGQNMLQTLRRNDKLHMNIETKQKERRLNCICCTSSISPSLPRLYIIHAKIYLLLLLLRLAQPLGPALI